MKRTKLIFWGIGLVAACAWLARAEAAAETDEVLLHYHFAGEGAFSGATNFARLRKILELTNTMEIQRGALRRLAASTAELFQAGRTTPAQAKLLEPLWEDAVRAESVADWRGTGPDSTEMVFLVKLAAERAGLWNNALREVLSQWRPGGVETEGEGWKAALGPGATLRFSRQRGWVALTLGPGDGAAGGEMLRRARAGEAPETFATPLEWLTADVNWPQLQPWLPKALGPFRPARARVSVRMTNDNVRTEVSFRYPADIPWEGENWTPPTRIIGWPVISLTGSHNLAALLNGSELFDRLGYNPLAGDLYFWAQPVVKFQSFFLAKVSQAPKLLRELGEKAPAVFNPELRARNWGGIYYATNMVENVLSVTNAGKPLKSQVSSVTNLSSEEQLRLGGLPVITPMITATNDGANEYLLGGLFPAFPMDEAFPSGLSAQMRGKSDLVYYDWELSAWQLDHWAALRNMLPLFSAAHLASASAPSPVALFQTDESMERLLLEERWFSELIQSGALGEPVKAPRSQNQMGIESLRFKDPRESVTELRRVSPREFSFLRKSACGLTAVEMVYLAHWLTGPSFPLGGGPFGPPAAAAPANPAPEGVRRPN